MNKKILYSITTDNAKDISFIGEKIVDYFGDKWHDAIEYALTEAKKK